MEYVQTVPIQIDNSKPQFDVILRFEPLAEELFYGLISKLAQATGNTTRLCNGQPPHVSMGIFDIADNSNPVQGTIPKIV